MHLFQRLSARLCALLCALVMGAACQPWALPPRAEDALMAPITVRRPLGQGALGQLSLLQDGSWALVRDKEAGSAFKLTRGQLVHIVRADTAPDEQPPRHLMVVTQTPSWGALLQRLDAQPIPDSAPVYALPREDQGAVRFPGACEGQGDPTADPCLAQAPIGTRWQLWPLDNQRHVPLQPRVDDALRLDAPRRGIAQRDAAGVRYWAGMSAQDLPRWIAMPFDGRRAPPPAPLYAAQACGELTTELSQPVEGRQPADDHPLTVEATSYDTLADVFVRCGEDGEVRAMVASLLRPPLVTGAGERLGPSVLGHEALVVQGGRLTASLVVDMLGALARGDAELADLFGERLLHHLHTSDGVEEAASKMAQLVAAAGRPEAALRIGYIASERRWRRDGDVRWQLTQIAVWAALGRMREAAAAERDLEVMLGRRTADPSLMPWLYWRSIREQLARGQRVDLQQPDLRWMLALRLLEALGSRERLDAQPAIEQETLTSESARVGAATLWEAVLSGQPAPAPCPAQSCPLDFYGRRLSVLLTKPSQAALDQVRRIGRLGFWPWTLTAQPALSRDMSLPDAVALSLVATLSGDTPPDDAFIARLDDTATDPARRAALCSAASRAVWASAQPLHPDLVWLVSIGLPAICAQHPTMIEEVAAHLSSPGAGGPVVWSALRAWLLAAPSPTRLTAAIQLARAQRSAGDVCARLSLALAAAQLDAQQIEPALISLEQAMSCPGERPAALAGELDAMRWLAQFERGGADTGATPAAQELLRRARQASAAKLPTRCAALFDVRLEPAAVLSPWSAAIVATLTLPLQESALLTVRRMEADAVSYVREAAALLDKGDLVTANQRLATARGLFERIGYTGAQARLDLIARGLTPPALAPRRGQPAPPALSAAALADLDAQPTLTDADRARLTALALVYYWTDPAGIVARLERTGACQ
jgi:hypothetical protein